MLVEAHKIIYKKVNGISCDGYLVATVFAEEIELAYYLSLSFFSEAELNHLEKIKSSQNRYYYATSKLAAKHAVNEYYRKKYDRYIQLNSIEIGHNILGTPMVYIEGVPINIMITISHSTEMTIVLVGDENLVMGIDCDYKKSLTKSQLINWTQKEALGKILGIGICARSSIYQTKTLFENGGLYQASYINWGNLSVYTICLKNITVSLAYHENMDSKVIENLFVSLARYLDNDTFDAK